MMATCAVCKKPEAVDVRLIVRDDYETVRGSFALPLTEADTERIGGILDSIVDGYRQQECRECRGMQEAEAAREAAYFAEVFGGPGEDDPEPDSDLAECLADPSSYSSGFADD